TAWMDHHQIAPDQRKDKLSGCFFIPIVENLLIDRPADLERLIKGISDICPDVSLIIFDPLVSFMSGDENNAHDTQDLVHAMRKLAESFESNDCSVMVVHHSGKEASRQERGSSALRGGVETLLELSGHKMLRVIKQRDAAKHEDIQIRFTTAVQSGEDGETQELGQVVIQPENTPAPETADPLTLPPSSLAPRIRRTRKNKETMLRILADTAYTAPDTVFVVSEFFTQLRKLSRAEFSCKKSSYYTLLRVLANGDDRDAPVIVRPSKSRVFTLIPDALKKYAPDLRAEPSDTEDQIPDEPAREADATEDDK
ncbi:AAA family ATPase, partial [Magnetospirillum moscoviense]|uniref:AAA family ATPase n=1 Tax=Magnetospirillum moscoviense TaxID=1437059 RepID=UPI000B029AD0